jgi:hypothetical protein
LNSLIILGVNTVISGISRRGQASHGEGLVSLDFGYAAPCINSMRDISVPADQIAGQVASRSEMISSDRVKFQ